MINFNKLRTKFAIGTTKSTAKLVNGEGKIDRSENMIPSIVSKDESSIATKDDLTQNLMSI